MVFVNKTYEQMLKEIGFRGYAKQDAICPDRNPGLFDRFLSFGEEHVFPKKSYIRTVLDDIPCSERDDVYLEQILAETAQNSYEWGHNRDGSKPISVEVAKGKNGSVVRISDSGKGHNYDGSFHRGGTATKLLKMTNMEVAPEGCGNVLNILVMNQN